MVKSWDLETQFKIRKTLANTWLKSVRLSKFKIRKWVDIEKTRNGSRIFKKKTKSRNWRSTSHRWEFNNSNRVG